ncbi:MAG: HAMP domain-containing sensor histidine kinase [Tepidisphaeraceae bacterium]
MFGNDPEFSELLTAFDAVADRIAVLNASGSLVLANEAWTREAVSQGFCRERLMEVNYIQLVEQAVQAGFPEAARVADGIRRVASGEDHVFRYEYPCYPHDSWKWSLLTVTAAHTQGERRLVAVHQDRTAEHETQELASSHDRLRRMAEEMDDALAEVSHELRTPLASMAVTTELLRDLRGASHDEYERFVEHLHHTAWDMMGTVDNILEAARLDSGHAKWRFSLFSLRSVVDGLRATLGPLVPPGVTVNYDIDENDRVSADEQAIRRLLLNLLSNAIKHTTAGTITLSASRPPGDGPIPLLELQVSDTGGGMSEEAMANYNEPFKLNGGPVVTAILGGTGLGLRICQRIVSVHGGDLRIRSRPGLGTTVTVRLRADLDGPQD